MVLKFVPIDRIYNKVSSFKPEGFNESEILDWVGEALEFMEVPKILVECVCYVEVVNYQAVIPQFMHDIIQIVRDRHFVSSNTSTGICPINVLTDSETVPEDNNIPIPDCYQLPNGEGNPVVINQLGQPLTDFELAYYRPYFNLEYDYLSWSTSNMYLSRFEPVRLKENKFFNSIVCSLDEVPYVSCDNEYTIIEGEILRFNFETGAVMIAYNRQKLDSNGVPMIPDHVSVIAAIMAYIRFKYAEIDFYNNRQGSETRYSKAEADWHWYCRQAVSAFKMPSSIDEWQNLLEGRNYLFPRQHYYGYFGHLGKNEQRNFLK